MYEAAGEGEVSCDHNVGEVPSFFLELVAVRELKWVKFHKNYELRFKKISVALKVF